jgi:plastocyanin
MAKRWAVALLLVAGLSACGGSTAARSTSGRSSSQLTVQAGINDPADRSIAIVQYMPAAITITAGTTVRWVWDGAVEPHSVTFFPPGQAIPAPGSDTKLFAATLPSGPYDGSAFVNSGLQPLGPVPARPFEVNFGQPGTYTYHCVIHPNMIGTVTVSSSALAADTADAVTSRGKSELQRWSAEGEVAKQRLVSAPARSTTNADGTKTWRVQMGASAPHTDVLAFAPVSTDVKPGDQVEFVNDSAEPHTASFFGQTPPILNPLDPRTDKAAPGPSPQTLNATALFNSGLLPPNVPPGAGPPDAARSFTFAVPASGTYGFECILHVSSGMAGTITAR